MRSRVWVCVVAMGVLAGVAEATPALDKPAFTATPAELQSVATAAPKGGSDVVVLREDHDISYDDRGRLTARWRLVFVVASQAGIQNWSTFEDSWLPARQDKPKVRARVISANGRVAELDPAAITDVPAGNAAHHQPGERRYLEAPLPPLSVGAIVEQEVIVVDREPAVGGGASYAVRLGATGALATHVKLSSPAAKKLHLVAHNLPPGTKPKTETSGGRKTIKYTFGALPRTDSYEYYLPADARQLRTILVSLAASWKAVAREYNAIIDKRIGEGPFALPAELPKTASLDTVRAIVAWLHRNVPSSGVDVEDAPPVPSTPAETVTRGRANALDSATLLAAMLRQAGMRAELALIDVGPGPDIDREVPAINVFDHALVRVRIGKTEVWLDPAARLMAPGKLPSRSQGRLALVIADDTSALVTTPVSRGTENRVREVRTFELAEAGTAKVTEVSRESGVFEAEQRVWIRDTAADAVRKSLGTYAENELMATFVSYTTTPVDDLTKPFEMTVVTKGSMRGYSGREQIDVYLFPANTLKKIPGALLATSDAETPRKHDFALDTPHVYEIENRLVVPAGFTMPMPAADQTRELGPFKLYEKQRVDGRTFVVTFRLDATRARLTPAEYEKARRALAALEKEEALHIVIPHTGSALAEQGRYREAIAEVQKLIAAHPKEALHHQQLASVLVKAGAGAAARRAARKAVELEPKSADAHVVLGWVLQHDSLGNWLGFDHDHAGAVAALRKAHKLDPKHVGAAADLAAALERNAKGSRFDTGADIRGAVQAWRAARAIDDTTDHAYSLAIALIWAGEAGEAEKVLKSMRSEQRRDQLLIAAAALSAGPQAAIRLANTLGGVQTKSNNLTAAGGILMFLRRYDAMRALLTEANALQAGTVQAKLMQALVRADKPFKPTNTPRDIVTEWMLAELVGRKSNVYWDARTRDEIQESVRKTFGALRRTELMTDGLIQDIIRIGPSLTVEGDQGLWRVELEALGNKAQVYLASDRGAIRLIATSDVPAGAGRYVWRLLAKNDEKNALRLLDWVASDVAARVQKDRTTHELAQLWGDNLPRTRAAMEVAAAVLAADSDKLRAIAILEKCKPTTSLGQLACDWRLSDLYFDTAKWAELEAHARDWATRAPKQLTLPVMAQAYGLAHLGRFDDAERVVAEALAKEPDKTELVFTRADLAIGRGQVGEAIRRIETLAKKPSPEAMALNNLAWIQLYERRDLKTAAANASKALQSAPDNANALNTLAAIQAELGELGDARRNMLKTIEVNRALKPQDGDLYVQGRILEQLGLTSDAIEVYRQLKPSPKRRFIPSSYDLAQGRLRALGVKK